MSQRREARERALQALFQFQMNPRPEADLTEDLDREWRTSKGARAFAKGLIGGVLKNRAALDERIRAYADNWDISRIGGIELAALRMALFEMFFMDDIPPVVTINEAIEIAKTYGGEESGRFVNGILDRAAKDVKRDPRKRDDA